MSDIFTNMLDIDLTSFEFENYKGQFDAIKVVKNAKFSRSFNIQIIGWITSSREMGLERFGI